MSIQTYTLSLIKLNQAVYCGLIINELINNSLKHAFGDGRWGEISISFEKDAENYILIVADNGIGLDDSATKQSLNSIGIQIVNRLTKQLKGSVEFKSEQGTEVKLIIPAE